MSAKLLRSREIATALALATAATACGSSSFRGASAKGDGPAVISQGEVTGPNGQNQEGRTNGPGTPGSSGGNNSGGGDNGGGDGTIPEPEKVANPCTGADHEVLILDFKSGWFSGDGGDFFQKIVNGVCGGQVRISYIHFTMLTTQTNLTPTELAQVAHCAIRTTELKGLQVKVRECDSFSSFAKYDSLWLLSGDEDDELDIRLQSALFRSLQTRAIELRDQKPSASFFFGAGLGNISHANMLAQKVFPAIAGTSGNPDAGLFAPWAGNRGVVPQATYPDTFGHQPLKAGTGTDAGTFAAHLQPFAGFTSGDFMQPMGSLFDYTTGPKTSGKVQFQACLTDRVVAAGGTTLATDHCGQAAVKRFQQGGHTIVAEGNTARFYGDKNLFTRIVMSLLNK